MNDIAEYRRLKFLDALRFVFALAVCLAVIAFLAFSGGCAAVPVLPAGAYDFVTNAAQRAVVVLHEARDPATTSTEEHEEHGEGAQASSDSPSSPSSPVLVFKYGGFAGDPAAEDSRCRISNLRIGSDSLSFHWDTGIPSDWTRGDTKKGPMVLACAFYWDGSRWIGGKFDWIDEHRSSRSLENIHGGYGGWNAGAWNAAKRRAFCVVSADGRHRSNLLEETR